MAVYFFSKNSLSHIETKYGLKELEWGLISDILWKEEVNNIYTIVFNSGDFVYIKDNGVYTLYSIYLKDIVDELFIGERLLILETNNDLNLFYGDIFTVSSFGVDRISKKIQVKEGFVRGVKISNGGGLLFGFGDKCYVNLKDLDEKTLSWHLSNIIRERNRLDMQKMSLELFMKWG